MSDYFLFPPPKRTENRPIVALVVEKKGDESRTSMKQDEIFCFSPWIRIRDGNMIMAKIHWSQYEPGDWFTCYPEYAVDRDGNIADEKAVVDLQKIEPEEYSMCGIPPTVFHNGNVRIKCLFTLCPRFIRNRETLNRKFHKLYLLNIGQGFFNANNPLFASLTQRSYHGIFEFRSKDNGAVNFTRKVHNPHDPYYDVFERDSMWELVGLGPYSATPEEVHQMSIRLVKLRQEAEDYKKMLRNQRCVELQRTRQTSQSGTGTVKAPPKEVTPKEEAPEKEPAPEGVVEHQEDDPYDWKKHMDAVIKCGYRKDSKGVEVRAWKDLETGDVSTDLDLLTYKFRYRYGIPDNCDDDETPKSPTPTALSPPTPTTAPAQDAPPQPRPTTLAARESTPTRPSTPSRTARCALVKTPSSRNVVAVIPSEDVPNAPEASEDVTVVEEETNLLDQTSMTLALLRQDNNANPMPRQPAATPAAPRQA